MIAIAARRTRFDTNSPNESLGTELHRTANVMKCVYDFAVQGGAIGSVNLLDDLGNKAILPSGAIINRVLIDTATAPTSGGSATVALSAQSAGDLKAALAIASYTGRVDGVPQNTAATSIKLTADRQVTATIAVAALTAGKIYVYVEYFAA